MNNTERIAEINTGELLRAAQCIYLACEQPVADDIAAKLNWAASEIDRLTDLTQRLGACEDCHSAHEILADGLKAELEQKTREVERYRQKDSPTPEEMGRFVRCEECIHHGWTDDATAHCNLWRREDDPMCVGYLGFCGAGTKGRSLELEESALSAEGVSE